MITIDTSTYDRICISFHCKNKLEPHNALSCDDCIHRVEIVIDKIDEIALDDDYFDDPSFEESC